MTVYIFPDSAGDPAAADGSRTPRERLEENLFVFLLFLFTMIETSPRKEYPAEMRLADRTKCRITHKKETCKKRYHCETGTKRNNMERSDKRLYSSSVDPATLDTMAERRV